MGDASTQLGRYQLVRKLATGGMAEVFLAKAIGPGGFEKSLVIKRILPSLAQDPEFVEMFLHEARLAAQLNHPNVVQIFDFGEVDGTYYLAMEYVDGPNLRSVLRRAPGRKMPATLGAKLIAQACEGLAYAHEFADPATGEPLNLIHRDVSADNLLVARNGTVKVVDFGVAKVEGQATRDEPGVVKGKIAYMPPEQIVGTPDKRADVYALGVILYELAAGARPYEQSTDAELMKAIVQTDPVPLRTRAPEVPLGFASVVEKAMARNVDERFASCHELQAALEDFLHSTGERVGSVHLAQFVSSVMGVTATTGTFARVGGADVGTGAGARGTPVSSPSASRATGVRPSLSPPATGRTAAHTGVVPAVAPVIPPVASPARPRTGVVPAIAPLVPASSPSSQSGAAASSPSSARVASPLPGTPASSPSSARVASSASARGAPDGPGATAAALFGDSVLAPRAGAPGPSSSPSSAPMAPLPSPPGDAEWDSLVDDDEHFEVRRPPPSSPTRPPAPASSPSAVGRRDASAAGPLGLSLDELKAISTSSVAALPTDVAVAPPTVDEWELDVPTGVGKAPELPPTRPALAPGSAEARMAEVMGQAEALRNYEPGPPLVTDGSVAAELERDETVNLFVRFATHAARLMPVHPHAPAMLAERVVGAVEGLVTAEAWAPLARLLERLEVLAPTDANSAWVWSTAHAAFATPEQVQRVLERLREAAPADAEGFGRCLRFFGPKLVPVFLEALEQLELSGSREALMHGLAELARLHPEPFVARLVEERPRRLADFAWMLEKGRVADRQKAFRQVLTRRDPGQRRELLSGLARARTEEAYTAVSQALGDRDEAVRLHALGLLAKHYPERVLRHAEPLLAPDGYEARSAAERQAAWRAVGHATQPEALACIVAVLKQKPSLLNRARVQQLKVDALEGLVVNRSAAAQAVLHALFEDASQPPAVVDAARRLAGAVVDARAVQLERRWDRVPTKPRAFLRELSALVQAARLVDPKAPALDVPFRRLRVQVDALLAQHGRVDFAVAGRGVTLNGLAPSDADDAAMQHLAVMCGRYQVGGFSLQAPVPDGELRELARWMAEGPCAAGVQTPGIQRQVLGASAPPRPVTPAPALGDPSREAMSRYVDLLFSLKEFLAAQARQPKLRPGDAQRTLDELASAMQTRAVRFVGLSPRSVGRDAVAFHHANVAVLALAFAAELGVPLPRLRELAEVAFFHDVGMYELPEETLARAGELTAADRDAMQAARRASAWFPFERLGADRRALSWATAIVEYALDWGARDEAGVVLQRCEIGVVGGILALAKMYDALTSRRSFRAALSPEAALETMVTKAGHRFRPDLLGPFVAFVRRHRLRPLAG